MTLEDTQQLVKDLDKLLSDVLRLRGFIYKVEHADTLRVTVGIGQDHVQHICDDAYFPGLRKMLLELLQSRLKCQETEVERFKKRFLQ